MEPAGEVLHSLFDGLDARKQLDRQGDAFLGIAALTVTAACRVARPSGYDALAAEAPTVTLSPERWKPRPRAIALRCGHTGPAAIKAAAAARVAR